MAFDDPAPSPTDQLTATLSARVESIVLAAEREATQVQRDIEARRRAAEQEAERYVADVRRRADEAVDARLRRLDQLTHELVERGELMRQHFDALVASIDRVRRAIETDGRLVDDVFGWPELPVGDAAAAPGGAAPAPASLEKEGAAPADASTRVAPAPDGAAAGDPGQREVPQAVLDALPPELRRRVGLAQTGTNGPDPAPAPASTSGEIAVEPDAPAAPTGTEEPPAPAAAAVPAAAVPAAAPPAAAVPADVPAPAAAPAAEPSRAARPADDLSAARLVALEMAASGRTRAEVDQHLRDAFLIDDTRALLDDVFGQDPWR